MTKLTEAYQELALYWSNSVCPNMGCDKDGNICQTCLRIDEILLDMANGNIENDVAEDDMKKQKKATFQEVLKETKTPMCRCNIRPATIQSHTCPFQVEINEDRKFKCNCCAECEEDCAMEI